MNESLSIVGAWLIDFSWLATVLLLAAVAMRLVPRDPAGRVLLAWGTSLSLLGGAFVLALPWWPRYDVTRFIEWRSAAASVAVADAEGALPEAVVVIETVDLGPPAAERDAPSRSSLIAEWPQAFAAIWLSAAVIASGWMAVGWFQAWRLVRTSRAAPRWVVEELSSVVAPVRRLPIARRLPTVRISDRIGSAVALGAAGPRIILPAASAVEANGKAVRAALAHEWAHIRHGDLWLLAIERLLVPLLVLHPLFWWLRRATRLDQELLADAAAAGDKPVEYAEALVAWAKAPASATVGLAALAMWERPSNLSRRVNMILHCERRSSSAFGRACGWFTAATLLAAAAGLSLMTVHPVAANQEPAEPASPSSAPAAGATIPAPPIGVPIPSANAIPSATPVQTTVTAPVQTIVTAPATAQERPVITLSATLMVRDFDRVTWSQIRSIGDLERVDYKEAGNTERHVLKAELVDWAAQPMIEKLEAMDGLRTLCRSKIIAFSGQQAEITVTEQGPRVEIEPRDDTVQTPRFNNQSQDIAHIVSVTPRTTDDPKRIELTVFGGRLKLNVGVGNTLLLVSTASNEILFISPIRVERQRGRVSTITRAAGLPGAAGPTTRVPAPVLAGVIPAGAVPVVPVVPAPPGTSFPAGASAFQPFAPAPPAGSSPISPATAAPQSASRPLPASTPAAKAASTAQRSRETETQRKLLELDLAAAKLEVEAAEVELAEVEEIRKKNPSAVGQQELRKRQLQIERAKIQVKRIEVQLDGAVKAPMPRASM